MEPIKTSSFTYEDEIYRGSFTLDSGEIRLFSNLSKTREWRPALLFSVFKRNFGLQILPFLGWYPLVFSGHLFWQNKLYEDNEAVFSFSGGPIHFGFYFYWKTSISKRRIDFGDFYKRNTAPWAKDREQ